MGLAGSPTTLSFGSYTLISDTAGGLGAFTLGTPTLSVGPYSYLVALASTGTSDIVTLTSAGFGTLYFDGSINNVLTAQPGGAGTPTNFTADKAGTIAANQLPSSSTDVFFDADTVNTANLNTVLGGNLTVGSLTFLGTGPNAATGVSIGGSDILTISGSPATPGVGIVVQSGSAAATISSKVALGRQSELDQQLRQCLDRQRRSEHRRQRPDPGGHRQSDPERRCQRQRIANRRRQRLRRRRPVGGQHPERQRILNTGTLALNSAGALGNATFIINGGTLDNTGGASVTQANANTIAINSGLTFAGSNALNLGTGPVTLGTASGTSRTITVGGGSPLTIGGTIANGTTANSLIKAGTGTLSLAGANTYTGGTTVSQGTLTAAANAALGSADGATSGVTLAPTTGNTATVNFTSAAPAVAALNSSGAGTSSVVLGNAVAGSATGLTIGGTGNLASNYAGTIGDGTAANAAAAGSLIKAGTNTLTLSGNNTYTGGTTVGAGTLVLTGTNDVGSGGVHGQQWRGLEPWDQNHRPRREQCTDRKQHGHAQ